MQKLNQMRLVILCAQKNPPELQAGFHFELSFGDIQLTDSAS
jgi:hypothetical protein